MLGYTMYTLYLATIAIVVIVSNVFQFIQIVNLNFYAQSCSVIRNIYHVVCISHVCLFVCFCCTNSLCNNEM